MSVSTVRCVSHHHELRGSPARMKLLVQTQNLKAPPNFAADHMDKEKTFWRKTLWSLETNWVVWPHWASICLEDRWWGLNTKNTTPTVQLGAGSMMVWSCSAVSGSVALKKVNGIMKKEDYLQILQENLRSSTEDWVLGAVGCSSRTVIPTLIRSGKWMYQSG